ncbi:mechanosensitive ion channel family protein [Pseudothauera rhizosphaerae]|uniref:Small-conductance mechanosensitive channel n=1 Tax=Pseudothauera rhizosphaerae TaxID=2565932 RepID=A0A4S4ABR4_9RHOO|nr:mechanosensitive ion channel domain-containing protein [Pseudothauera rhizosphaerae]THF55603.1 mechanosensitive ion channel [Pseudothauera rhizosphaerae]
MEDVNGILSRMHDIWLPLLVQYGGRLLLALITLVVGWWLVGKLTRSLFALLARRHVEPTLHSFLGSLIGIALKVLLLVSVAGMVGVETTSFIAMIGAAGLTVGLALQGSLANFAGGVLILIFRPFKVGEYIEAQGMGGTVDQIQIFHTILRTADNKTVVIPNGNLSNGSVVNYSRQHTRRVDLSLGIAYDDDVKTARAILLELAGNDPRVLADPAPVVWLASLGESSVNLVLRVWAKTDDYWPVFFELQEQAKERFDAAGLTIPFPQRTLHVVQGQAIAAAD